MVQEMRKLREALDANTKATEAYHQDVEGFHSAILKVQVMLATILQKVQDLPADAMKVLFRRS